MKDIILNGEKIGRTWCKSCAQRAVRIRLWKIGKPANGQAIRRGMKETATEFQFTNL